MPTEFETESQFAGHNALSDIYPNFNASDIRQIDKIPMIIEFD